MLASILLACDVPIGLRATVRGDAEQGPERRISMVSAVEAEDELVEIGIHMLPAKAAVISAETPSLHESKHAVDPRERM